MQFPENVISTLVIPTGAEPGTSRTEIRPNGEIITFGNPPDTTFPVFASMFKGGFQYGIQNPDGTEDSAEQGTFGLSEAAVGHPTGIWTSPISSINNIAAAIQLVPGNASADPVVVLGSSGFAKRIFVNVVGFAVQQNDASGGDTVATWQTPTANTNWSIPATSATVQGLEYRKMIEDDVWWLGRIDYTGANVTAAGALSAVLAVPSDFAPGSPMVFAIGHETSAGVVKNTNALANVMPDGTVSILWGDGVAGSAHDINGLATGDRFFFNARIPIGNIA